MTTRRDADEAALRAAMRVLARVPRTRRQIHDLLIRRFDSSSVAHALDELERRGLLSDAATAETLAHARQRRGWAAPRIEQDLIERGVEPGLARQVARSSPGTDDRARALELALHRARRAPPHLDTETLRRRLAAYLARRGYDEQTCMDAATAAVRSITRP